MNKICTGGNEQNMYGRRNLPLPALVQPESSSGGEQGNMSNCQFTIWAHFCTPSTTSVCPHSSTPCVAQHYKVVPGWLWRLAVNGA